MLLAGGKLRWIAVLYSLGALLILAEILSAQEAGPRTRPFVMARR